MRNIRFKVAYDGSAFFGWQRQDGFPTVQEAIEDALGSLLGDAVTIHGAGRTDAGVHAQGQVAHCHLSTSLADDRLRHALNAHVEEGIAITHLETCRDDFHARFDARGKRYVYTTATTRFRPPGTAATLHWINRPLDRAAMRAAAHRLEGRHDFQAFGNSGSVRKTTVRTIHHLRLVAYRDRFAWIVQGDGFLYNMVRTIAGTLQHVGLGKIAPEAIDEILASRDRSQAGPTAPACGLALRRVLYAEPTFRRAIDPRSGAHSRPGLFP